MAFKPSLCGMLLYKEVMSIVKRKRCCDDGGKAKSLKSWRAWFVSLMYVGNERTRG